MENLKNYQLYFEVLRKEDAELINLGYPLNGTLVTEKNVRESMYILSGRNIYRRLELKKYATNNNDCYKERYWVGDRQVEETFENLETIVVWLGTENTVYQKSGRIVSSQDLVLLSNGIHKYEENKKRARYQNHSKKYKCGKRGVYKKHSYLKNYSNNYQNIRDNFREYPLLKRKMYKENADILENYDSHYDSISRKGNGWKDNSKAPRQYLKHQ